MSFQDRHTRRAPADNQLCERGADYSLPLAHTEADLRDTLCADIRALNTEFLRRYSRPPDTASPAPTSRRLPVKLAFSMSVAFAALVIPVPKASAQAALRSYSTAIGQRQTINLEDGSSITLNTQSKVSILLGPKEREVRLLAGEVFFHVVHDADRPFRVFNKGVLLEDLGTDFNVYNYESAAEQPGTGPSGVRVSVLEGSIRLYCNCVDEQAAASLDSRTTQSAAPSPFVSKLLVAGQISNITHVDGVDRLMTQRLSEDDRRRVSAWRNGQIILNQMTLAQAVGEFNRYNIQQMMVSPEIANIIVGGRFGNPDYRSFIAALAYQYHIEALPPNSAGNPSTALRLMRRSGR